MSDWLERRRPVRQLVLCVFRAWSRVNGSSVTWRDAIMIGVPHSCEIQEAFHWEMRRRLNSRAGWHVGPKPMHYELVSYLTESGRPTFDFKFQQPGEHRCLVKREDLH